MSKFPGVSTADPADLSRRERRKLEVRGRILEAASHLFSEHGFQDSKVADICERADVAHKTFFNHFPSKQHLLREIAAYAIDELLVDIEAARKREHSTAGRLAAFFSVVAERTADLRLDDPALSAEFRGRRDSLIDRERDLAARHRNPVALEDLLRLVFVDLHRVSLLAMFRLRLLFALNHRKRRR